MVSNKDSSYVFHAFHMFTHKLVIVTCVYDIEAG